MILEVSDLSFSYRSRHILDKVSFEAPAGTFISVLGPNGVGKSTLFRCILRILTDYEGTVRINGKKSSEYTRRELAGLIAYIPQIHRPTFGYSVLDTVLMGVTSRFSPFTQPSGEHRKLAYAALEKLGIAALAERNYTQLSGGEQQLVLVARAMAQQGNLLIMDEPTSALDYGNQIRVLRRIRQLTDEGYSILLSTHNPQHALSFSDRILALSEGRIAADGAPSEVLNPELIKTLYGIDSIISHTELGNIIVNK